jgi:hypothetical protein
VDLLIFTSFYLETDAISRCIRQRNIITFCANLGKVLRRPWTWLDKRSGKKPWAAHRNSKLAVAEKRRDRWRPKSLACSSFSDTKVTVRKEFVLADQTVNSAYYRDVLWRRRENVLRLRLELWRQSTACCIGPKISFWSDIATSSGNYGWLFVILHWIDASYVMQKFVTKI